MISHSEVYSKLYRHAVEKPHGFFIWSQKTDFPFDELIFSWNSVRPEKGYFTFFFRFFCAEWSSWVKFAEWGRCRDSFRFQRTISYKSDFIVDVDTIRLNSGFKASAFEIKVESECGAELSCLHTLWASCIDRDKFVKEKEVFTKPTFELSEFKGFSQMVLNHPRHHVLCSPTSTFMALNYLSNLSDSIESFLAYVYDKGHDIFGNWALNAAGAYELSTQACAVHKLASFSELYDQLLKSLPVVVSVKGELNGAPKNYPDGHLMVVTGYNAEKQTVKCFDPAFSCDSDVCVDYAISDFMHAWSNRGRLCYLIGV